MKLPRRALCALALVGLLACPVVSSAGPLSLTIANGRVTLSAQDVPLRQILAEWERLGGLRIINRDRVPGASVTIELTDVQEEKALETVLRPAAGFVAVEWAGQPAGASIYSRIIVMPGTAAPVMASVRQRVVAGERPRAASDPDAAPRAPGWPRDQPHRQWESPRRHDDRRRR